MAEVVLDVEDLTMEFGGSSSGWFAKKSESVKAVDGISFSVYRRETFGIVGRV